MLCAIVIHIVRDFCALVLGSTFLVKGTIYEGRSISEIAHQKMMMLKKNEKYKNTK